jgi:hypothetical protein
MEFHYSAGGESLLTKACLLMQWMINILNINQDRKMFMENRFWKKHRTLDMQSRNIFVKRQKLLYQVLVSTKFQKGLNSIKGMYKQKVEKNIAELAEYIKRLKR